MVSPRSTSPPKSAWPGVSTMLNLTPSQRTAVFLARMVMPFSLSRSPESMTRSVSSWLARKAPVCRRSASTRVVLPWSTWATMATLRMSSRLVMGEPTIEDRRRAPDGGLSGGGMQRSARARQHLGHRLGGQGQDGRFGLEPHPMPRIGPPADYPARPVAVGVAQRLHQRDQRELGSHRGPPRPRQHYEAAAPGPHLGPAPQGQQRGSGGCPTSGPGRSPPPRRRPASPRRTTAGSSRSPLRHPRRPARPGVARPASGRSPTPRGCRRGPTLRFRPPGSARRRAAPGTLLPPGTAGRPGPARDGPSGPTRRRNPARPIRRRRCPGPGGPRGRSRGRGRRRPVGPTVRPAHRGRRPAQNPRPPRRAVAVEPGGRGSVAQPSTESGPASQAHTCEAMARRCSSRTSSMP